MGAYSVRIGLLPFVTLSVLLLWQLKRFPRGTFHGIPLIFSGGWEYLHRPCFTRCTALFNKLHKKLKKKELI
jgi:hypothetical protein